ncbi:nucleoside triphosphate pyrophosphatase [Eikenella sp. NML120348]|uniref:Maf family protein n=1 Tax=Eikenella sp. NML120348 TaxID=1795831 RepID=UPI0007DF24E7|nr:nucleoside triphosphate pyrophosphatase [Eikenella sp. NML120348]OAM37874.1 septum formation protein Maf [Eikenella sp. NML120348]
MNTALPIVLASSSPFRRRQLAKLGLQFATAAPDCDETPLPGETPCQTAERLAEAKSRALVARFPQHLIIGADQVACCNGQQLGKPMDVAKAQQMLAETAGRELHFYSALCVLNTFSGSLHCHVDTTTVKMRPLTAQQIARYLERELDAVYCAGGAKSEGLGGALIERIDSSDPNALIGLPIFRLIDFLQAEGVAVL